MIYVYEIMNTLATYLKCDLILLLFDPHKLDVSDEFKRVISSLRGHDDKIRVVLNKADQVDTQQVKTYVTNILFLLNKSIKISLKKKIDLYICVIQCYS